MEDPRSCSIGVGEITTVSAGDPNLHVTNDDDIRRNGIIEYTVTHTEPNPFELPAKIKVTGLKAGRQKIEYTYAGYDLKSSYITITVDQVLGDACRPGSPEYNYFEEVFRFLHRPDLWENFRRAVEASRMNPRTPYGIIDWSMVWGEPGMDYTQSLQRVSRMLLEPQHRGRNHIDHFLARTREIRENRERVMQRYPQPDPGHMHVRNSWFYFEIAMELFLAFGALVLSEGTATPAVLEWLAARGVIFSEIAPYLIAAPK